MNNATGPSPKEQYDQRKAERERLAALDMQIRKRLEPLAMIELADRLVTALERAAVALERIADGKASGPTNQVGTTN